MPSPTPRSSRAARTARDNARARAAGYRDYYDYRLHDNGRIPPGPLELSPEERARRRGHRGVKDFLASLGEGDLIVMPEGLKSVERDKRGRYVLIHKLVIDGDSGQERNYFLRNLTRAQLVATIEEEEERGATFSPYPSLDQRRLVRDTEHAGGYETA